MFIKNRTKLFIGKLFSPLDKAILVNSYGRSGSTMLTKSIISSLAKRRSKLFNKILRRSFGSQAWNIDETAIRPGFVYKTHDYPPQNHISTDIRVVYIFADPIEVVLSLIRIFNNLASDEWMRMHFEHLKAEYVEDFYSIIDCDILNLEKHFDSWLAESSLPVAFVRYEKLWENQNNIGKFLNIPLELPPYRERAAYQSTDSAIIQRLERTYSRLRKKVYNCRDFFTINCRRDQDG